jgi:hypothetical protein
VAADKQVREIKTSENLHQADRNLREIVKCKVDLIRWLWLGYVAKIHKFWRKSPSEGTGDRTSENARTLRSRSGLEH